MASLIRTLGSDRAEEALQLVCDQFTRGSVLHHAMSIGVEEYRRHIENSFLEAIEAGLSLVALDPDTDAVVGCLVATPFEIDKSPIERVPRKFRPIKALLRDLEKMYIGSPEFVAGESMLVDIAVVSEAARGGGIYSKLRTIAQAKGAEAGFRSVVGELSSAATQYFCIEKLGHLVKAEIVYEHYEFEGTYPFRGILDPTSIKLAVSRLD